MARLEDFVAFRAALALHEEHGTSHKIQEIYEKCLTQTNPSNKNAVNYVQEFYAPFSAKQISRKIGEILSPEGINAEVEIIYQTIEGLHSACPKNLGDWYFTGNYPTPGGNRVVNKAFVNFFEGKKERAY